MTVKITATIGVKPVDSFAIDIVSGREPTGVPSIAVRALVCEMPELTPATVLVFPTVDHIADKLCATHARYSRKRTASSRPKDLYDLCALRSASDIDAALLHEAVCIESLARGLEIPARVSIPVEMRESFEVLARSEAPHPLVPAGFDQACEAISAFLDPVLGGAVAAGAWDAGALSWRRVV